MSIWSNLLIQFLYSALKTQNAIFKQDYLLTHQWSVQCREALYKRFSSIVSFTYIVWYSWYYVVHWTKISSKQSQVSAVYVFRTNMATKK